LTIKRHEMVALAGMEGSGQDVLLRVCAGLQRPAGGTVSLEGRRLPPGDGLAFRRAGCRFMPAARLEEGLFPEMSVAEHVAILQGGGLWLDRQAVRRQAMAAIGEFQVRGAPESRVWSLSGGNQQRLLLSFLPRRPRLLQLEHPTRGLDLASANWVWGYLRDLCHEGAAVVFTSSDLDEILMVADRILVFFNGRIVLDTPAGITDPGKVTRAMAGEAG
jgi:simple sugar transport system ATP-binding protein